MDSVIPYYPVNDFGPLMKGLVIGGVGILHVFLAQFAIGGGMLLYAFERRGQRGDAAARQFVDGFFRVLVLISFVVGAVTGVAMWLTTIQVGARTIGLMIDEFHWLWATEWVWFSIEVCAGYAFYRRGAALSDRARRQLLALYALAAWMSLFWINGILSWQLTPGHWHFGASVWAGFFNPSFWPSLLFRTAVATTLAALVACIVINAMALERETKMLLIRFAARFATPIAAMPLLALWYFATLPDDSKSWLLGGSIPMSMFVAVTAGASALIGGYVIIAILYKRLTMNAATATLLTALALGATAAGEFVREGARKPYTVRGVLYSTSLTPDDVVKLRSTGATTTDPYPLRDQPKYPAPQLVRGAKVFRALCDTCHTVRGANGVVDLVATWTDDQLRLNIAKLQRTKGFMPPFAGTAEDVEAVAQFLKWQRAGTPATWMAITDPAQLADIARWLDDAGTR